MPFIGDADDDANIGDEGSMTMTMTMTMTNIGNPMTMLPTLPAVLPLFVGCFTYTTIMPPLAYTAEWVVFAGSRSVAIFVALKAEG